jgi:hypothetical protein
MVLPRPLNLKIQYNNTKVPAAVVRHKIVYNNTEYLNLVYRVQHSQSLLFVRLVSMASVITRTRGGSARSLSGSTGRR